MRQKFAIAKGQAKGFREQNADGISYIVVIWMRRIYTSLRWPGQPAQTSRQWEVFNIDKSTAILIVAIITAAIAFATLIFRIVEVSRKK